MIIGLIFGLLLYPFCNKTRAERSDCRQERRRPIPNRRALAREHRVATKAAMRAKFSELMRRFRETFARRSLEDEEKEAILRRLHANSSNGRNNNNTHDSHTNYTTTSYSISDTEDDVSVSESDSDMSTTMEQDLASFRSVADAVGDMVMAAEEGRTRRAAAHHQHRHYQQHQPQPQPQPPRFTPSPAHFASRSRRSTFSDGISIDEELPAYEERPLSRVSVDSASHVSNGIRYIPGVTTYTPSDNTTTGSPLDEVLGRKVQR